MNARSRRGRAWIVLAAALAIVAVACGPGSVDKAGSPIAKPVLVTLADGEGDTSNAQPFANAVKALSHGTLQIKIEGAWRPSDPTYETDLIRDVQAGKAQLGITASRAFDTVGIDSFQALQAPFLIDNYALEQKVLNSQIPGEMLAGLKPAGLVGLAMLPGPLRRPFGLSKALVTISDYRGARIGIRRSEVTADIFRVLGAVPVTQQRSGPSGEKVSGLAGIESHVWTIGSGLAVPGARLTGNVVFEPRPNVIFMNQRAYDDLTFGQRDVLRQAATLARAAGIFEGNDAAAVADLCRRGIKIVSASPADLAGLRAAVQPVYRRLESSASTKAFIEEITSIRQAVGGSPDAVTCAAISTGGIAAAAAALQGTWQVAYTEKELVAAGADPSELMPSEGNWGQFTLKFGRGHWWETATPSTAPRWTAYGSYVVAGRQITFYRHDHDYTSSDTEVWGPYIWSVYRDTLTFKKVGGTGGTQGPTGLVVSPWREMALSASG